MGEKDSSGKRFWGYKINYQRTAKRAYFVPEELFVKMRTANKKFGLRGYREGRGVYKDRRYKLLMYAKVRAKKAGGACTIAATDIPHADTCPCCDCPLQYGGCGEKKTAPNAASLDKIIPELWYIPGNVVVVCHRCNTQKSNRPVHFLKRIYDFYTALQEKAQCPPQPH